ncbi:MULTISPECIES: sulfurtransferase [Pseudanabaena]|uniref:3-mercaptopyruvate sulfurtransferase n=2 Tax=Pseudanabaena TaxID=1152 RepID=L8MYF4_9CYAN|nr:3-mercaptopyruvate sulfurtransferase [Pseudanabaena biceps PCC 7429]
MKNMRSTIFSNSSNRHVVSAEWLHTHLHDQQLIIVDCRFSLNDPELGLKQYQASHIEGAHYLDLNLDLSSPVQKHGGRHPLPDFDRLASKLSQIGIVSGETMVVIYDDSRLGFAARLWWLLQYMGHEYRAVLDGGFAGWKAQKYPVSNEIPEAKAGKFIPKLQTELVVDREMVKARKDLPEVVLVDAREGDRYRGEREPIDPIAGHIEGAVNYPWLEVTNDQGFVIANQSDRWQQVQNAQEVIVYCGSGVTACVNLLSLKLAGIETGKLYAGSWSDWCSYLA